MIVRPAPFLLAAAVLWTILVAAAPVLGWPPVYAAGHRACHQIPARSFHVAGVPMAVCARCLGLYLGGVAAGGVALAAARRRPATSARRARRLIAAAALPTVITLFAEWILRWPVGNAARFIAALPLGATAAWLVVVALEVDWQA